MIAEKLRKAVLKAAMEGKLTEQFDRDGNAIDLINQIKKDRERLLSEKIIKYSKLKNKNVIDINIPKNWVITNINEIAFVTKLAGFEYTKYIANNLVESGVPLFKGKNIQNGKLNLEFESYIPKLVSQLLSRSRLDRKCLLTPYVGTIGNIAIFEADFEAHLGSNVGKIELFNHFRKNILEEYLLFFLRSEYGDAQLKRNKKATAQESISIQDIREVSVPIPPIEEQKRIVEKLEVLLAEIDKLEQDEKALKELEDKFPVRLKKSLLKSAIGGNFSKINLEYENKVDKLKYQNNESLNEVESLLGKINHNWIVTNLKQIADISTGRKDANHAKQNGIYRFYTCAKEYFMSDTFSFEGESLILPGNGANVGQVYRYSGKFEAYQRTYIIQLKSNFYQYIDMNYLEYLFHAYWGEYNKDKMFGSATPYIKLGNLVNFPVVIPPIEEQKRIVEKLDKLFAIDLLNI